ncbi:MAG TPA: serine/threonine-protein kinase, partial [Labilithrix sp.]
MSTDADQKRLRAAMELVDAALDAPPSQRAALLGDASSEVRAEAERLLAADACTNSVLSEPALAGAPSALDEATRAGTNALAPGALVGSFRIVSFLGRGGMGEVWIAERATADFDQRVALKILPVTDAAAVARFRQERRILARLAHPCIARLLDGGVMSDGRPWLAMELVAGKNLVDYCAEHELDVDARLHLFAQICDAVQLAHQSLVVHRDLKPSNILVGDDGAPKLLDFGIAKLLEHAADAEPLTRTHERPMTLDYAAPEQVRGEAISTASDIWSLGVILHELLTGVRPYRTTGKNRVETEHAILAAEPSRPSAHVDDPLARGRPLAASPRALRRRLRGDLDAIVLKAMRKAPKDRYATAEALAADVRRHLDHAPVAARGDATSYLVRATIRRHSVAFAFSGVVFVALVAGLVGTLWQAKRARDEARRAEQAQAFLVDMLRAFDPGQANGKPITQRDILERGEARLGELDTQPDVQALLLHTFAETWYGIEEFVHAEKTAERALDLERRTRGPRSLEAGRSLVLIGDSWFELGDYPRAASSLEEGLAILRAIEGPKGLTVASALNDLAGV